MSFPRILLLTPAAAAFPCAGGEVLRKICRALPAGCVYRASLQSYGNACADDSVHERFFPLPRMHWRLQRRFAGRFLASTIGAVMQARSICAWAAEIKAEKLWVLAEDTAVSVALKVGRRSSMPIHLTFHDAPEVSGKCFGAYPPLFMVYYMRTVRALLGIASSFDAVSSELVEHVKMIDKRGFAGDAMVFAPSMPVELTRTLPAPRCYEATSLVRRIGLCGSLRVSTAQWLKFLALLGRLPFQFEIVAYADPDYFPSGVVLPGNVTVSVERFLSTERDVVVSFLERNVHACYLGLWKDSEKDLFCRTSLSSKLSTYAAASLPVIVDGPARSAAWALVSKYNAGILLGSEENCRDDQASAETLTELFGNETEWLRKSEGSARLRQEKFNFEIQSSAFTEVLKSAATRGRIQ